MKLGISSHAYAWAIGVEGYPAPANPMTAIGLMERAVQLQVGVVQIADNLPLHGLRGAERRAIPDFAKRHALQIEVGTRGINPKRLRSYLEIARQLHSPIVRTLLDSPALHPTPAQAIDTLRPILPDFERAGVCLAIENHDRFPARVLVEILDALNSRFVGICLDTANSLGCGEGIDSLLSVLGPQVVNLHVKDIRAERLPHQKGFVIEGCAAGDGVIDIPRLLTSLKSYSREPTVIVELWVSPRDSLDATIALEAEWAVKSVKYLRRWVVD